MADNAAARSAHRAAALYGRRVAEAAGVRAVEVKLVVETYSGPVNVGTSTLTGTVTTTLDPRPKVRRLSERDTLYGVGYLAASAGKLTGRDYAIGPMTLPTVDGQGYSTATLMPDGSSSKRVYLTMTGDDFDSTERFAVTGVDASRPHQINLIVSPTKPA
jgi:hypothetical protein